MNLHEYQGKSILKSFGVAIQEGRVVDKVEDAQAAAKDAVEKFLASAWSQGLWIRRGGQQIEPSIRVAFTRRAWAYSIRVILLSRCGDNKIKKQISVRHSCDQQIKVMC